MSHKRRIKLLSNAAGTPVSARPLLFEAIALSLLTMCVCDPAMAQCKPEDVGDLVQRAAVAMQSDWSAFPEFASEERDSKTSKQATVLRTYRVFMIDGTDYYMPIAVNDKRYTAGQLGRVHTIETIDA